MNEELEKSGIRIERPVVAATDQSLPPFFVVLFILACILFVANAFLLLSEFNGSPSAAVSQSSASNGADSSQTQSPAE